MPVSFDRSPHYTDGQPVENSVNGGDGSGVRSTDSDRCPGPSQHLPVPNGAVVQVIAHSTTRSSEPGGEVEQPRTPSTSFLRIPCEYPVVIHLGVIIGLLSVSVILPTIIAGPLGQDLMGDSAYVSFSAVFVCVQGGLSFFSAGVIGRLSDVYGRKPLLLFTTVTLGVPPLLFGIAGSNRLAGLWVFNLATTVAVGLTGGDGGPVGIAFVADAVPPQDRPAAFAWLAILAPLILEVLELGVSGLSASMKAESNFVILSSCVVFSVAGSALVLVLPAEVITTNGDEDHTFEEASNNRRCNVPNPIVPLREAFVDPSLRWLCLVGALMTLAETLPRSATLFVYLNKELGIADTKYQKQQQEIRVLATMVIVFSTVFVGALIPALLRCMRTQTLLTVTIVMAMAATAAPVLAAIWPSTGIVVFVSVMGGAFTAPGIPLNALVSEAALSPELVGSAMGALTAAKALMNIFGVPLEAAAYNALDGAGVSWLTWVIFAGIGLMALIPATLFKRSFMPVEPPVAVHAQPSWNWCRVVHKACMGALRAVCYSASQSVFSVVALCVLVVTTVFSALLCPAQCCGVPLIAIFCKVVDAFATMDVSLASWIAPNLPRRRFGAFPISRSWPELKDNAQKFGVLRSLLYFVTIKAPLEVVGFLAMAGWMINALGFFLVPVLYLTGFSDMCLYEQPVVKVVISRHAPCTGDDVDTLAKSLIPVIPGVILLALGGFFARGLAQFSIWHVRCAHKDLTNQSVQPLVRQDSDNRWDSDYWSIAADTAITRPRLSRASSRLTFNASATFGTSPRPSRTF